MVSKKIIFYKRIVGNVLIGDTVLVAISTFLFP